MEPDNAIADASDECGCAPVPGGGGFAVMKVALINPPWRFENSIYFGCRAPHLPLERRV